MNNSTMKSPRTRRALVYGGTARGAQLGAYDKIVETLERLEED